MSVDTHQTAPTQFVEANGTRFAYRRFGKAGGVPIVIVLSAPTPFVRSEVEALKRAAADVIERHFPDAPGLYARHGWRLPTSIGRVYDAGRIERALGFRCATDFGSVLEALRADGGLPFAHQPA